MIMDKLQNIYNRLSSLLSHLNKINVTNLISLPKQINSIVVGNNNLSSYINGTIQEITSADLTDVTSIGDYAFQYCDELRSIIIPNTVTSIGNYCFGSYAKLRSITIPDSVISIGQQYNASICIYCYKDSYTASYVINNNMPYVFIDGNDIDSIYSEDMGNYQWKLDKRTGLLEFLGSGEMDDFDSANTVPWNEYKYYITDIELSKDITKIGEHAFYEFIRITNMVIPDGVTYIGYSAFFRCADLENVVIPNSVTHIDPLAFENCMSLQNVTIPNSVTYLGYQAFIGCTSLTDIYLNPTTPPFLGDTRAIPSHTTIHIPIGSGEAYKSATNWSYHSDRIVEDIEI